MKNSQEANIQTDSDAARPATSENRPRASTGSVWGFLRKLGPGLVTGASDDDPSGIATYAAAGAAYGYGTLWTALVTFPLMAGVQLICAKIGMVCGCGLAAVMRRHYPALLTYPAVLALVIANTINAAADLGAVAAGVNLLLPIPALYLILPIAVGILALQVWGSYRTIATVFKWLTLALFAYIGAAFLARPDWRAVGKGTFVPSVSLDSEFLGMLVAILGTTISPYLFFWQANQEVEEEIRKGRKHRRQRQGATEHELKEAAVDVNSGMLLSNVVMYFIILATGATLHQAGQHEVASATDAAEALRPLAGDAAFVLMGLGLIGSGVLAFPILTGSAAYAVAELFGWNHGLDEKPARAKGFYAVIAVATALAMVINFMGLDLMKALVWTAIINGLLAPPLLVIVMLVANNPKIVGKKVNGPVLNVLGWGATILVGAAALVLGGTWFMP
jgi:NRAMP (natural resistance-associated macrophage protein)-like metal ion transporter